MPTYLGDFASTAVSVQHKFMTVNGSGVPTTLGDSPSLVLYVNATTTGIASGVSGTFDFDGRTGLNHVRFLVTTSVTGVTSGTECQLVIATGSVSGVSLNGYPVVEFSLMNRPVQAVATNVGAVVTASNINIGAVVTAVNTIVPARVTAQGIDVGAIVTAVNTIVPARVTAQGIDVGAIVTAVNTIVPARVTAQGIDVGAIVTAINTNVGAIVTAVNTITPARVTAQGIDIGAIVTAVNTITPARVTAQGIDIGAIVTAINTIANANVTSISTVVNANVTAYSTVVAANVTAISAGIITFAAFSAGAIDANAIAADAVTEIQTGLALEATLSVVAANVTNLQSRIPAALSGGRMIADAQAFASVTVIGSGSTASLWRGA